MFEIELNCVYFLIYFGGLGNLKQNVKYPLNVSLVEYLFAVKHYLLFLLTGNKFALTNYFNIFMIKRLRLSGVTSFLILQKYQIFSIGFKKYKIPISKKL